ncbi:MAG: 2Fe-2S iron-sulfur cluster binding domain-containing protein [Chloroflexi bacterium]|nr:2Fe-2S iron-sulfur cluster binding domain-containing protein [Chloroflexota bacterium]
MAFTVTLVQSGAQFTVEPDETILEAAERSGVLMSYSCRGGICRSCLTRVISGCAEHDPAYVDELNIDASEYADHYRLLCSALACSDLELEK